MVRRSVGSVSWQQRWMRLVGVSGGIVSEIVREPRRGIRSRREEGTVPIGGPRRRIGDLKTTLVAALAASLAVGK